MFGLKETFEALGCRTPREDCCKLKSSRFCRGGREVDGIDTFGLEVIPCGGDERASGGTCCKWLDECITEGCGADAVADSPLGGTRCRSGCPPMYGKSGATR